MYMYHASRDDSGWVGRAVESVLRVIRGDTIEACNHAIDQRRACLISIYAYVCGSVRPSGELLWDCDHD